MYWWINSVAILLMIAVLEINPAYLELLSQQTSHTQWQLASYIALTISVLSVIIRYLLRLTRPYNPKVNTPVRSIKKWSAPFFISLLWIVPFFVAILSNALAQRLQLTEQSVSDTIYVEAWVSPNSISDRQLEFETEFETESKTLTNNKNKVTQGYRLLATLSHITPYDTADTSQRMNRKSLANPFHSNAKSSGSIDHTDVSVLPQTMTVLLTSYSAKHAWLNELKPNEKVRLQLALNPLEIPAPDAKKEFNEYRWLSTRHATATAKILKTNTLDNTGLDGVNRIQVAPNLTIRLNQHRYNLRMHLAQLLEINKYADEVLPQDTNPNNKPSASTHNNGYSKQQAMAVTLSLLTGDRSLISQDTTALYRFAGISHLLAISGAHVLFLAILAAWLATRLLNLCFPKLYQYISRWQVQLIIAVAVAFIYALFSGFDVPAARTAWMLLLVGIARYLLLSRATFKLLLGLATVMAWQDVFVLWQAGFWLSFVAVILLVAYTYRLQQSAKVDKLTQHYQTYMREHSNSRALSTTTATATEQTLFNEHSRIKRLAYGTYRSLRQFILLQLWMTLALLPVSLWLFGEVSLWGIAVNMVAIALFGWVIVPLNLLAGLLYSIASMSALTASFGTTLANSIWQLLFSILDSFHYFLVQLQNSTNHTGWLYTPISLPLLAIAVLIILPWLLPKGVLHRVLSLPAVVLFGSILVTQSGVNNVLGLDTDSPALIVTPLPLDLRTSDQRDTLSATLLSTPFENWLLLSTYSHTTTNRSVSSVPNTTTNSVTSDLADRHAKQNDLLINQIIKALSHYQVDSLTGVIVQTPSQSLADSAHQLKDRLPIQYYWQAGSQHLSKPPINERSTTHLVVQPCDSAQSWHTLNAEYSPSINIIGNRASGNDSNNQQNRLIQSTLPALQINAITGWQEINDIAVWDCVLQVTTRYPVYLNAPQSSSVQAEAVKTAGGRSTIEKVEKGVLLKASSDQNQTKLIFNSARHEQLWKLWQLMCVDLPISSSVSALNAKSSTKPLPTAMSTLSQHHWLSVQPAVLDKSLATQTTPLSFTLLDSNHAMDNTDALYWQQVVNEPLP